MTPELYETGVNLVVMCNFDIELYHRLRYKEFPVLIRNNSSLIKQSKYKDMLISVS